jgi:hypothetical protein
MFKRALLLFSLACFGLQSEENAVGTHRIFQFENDQVRVWKTVIMPRQPLKMHRHDHPRIVVGVKGGDQKN